MVAPTPPEPAHVRRCGAEPPSLQRHLAQLPNCTPPTSTVQSSQLCRRRRVGGGYDYSYSPQHGAALLSNAAYRTYKALPPSAAAYTVADVRVVSLILRHAEEGAVAAAGGAAAQVRRAGRRAGSPMLQYYHPAGPGCALPSLSPKAFPSASRCCCRRCSSHTTPCSRRCTLMLRPTRTSTASCSSGCYCC